MLFGEGARRARVTGDQCLRHRETHGNAVHLVNQKAKELAGLLRHELNKQNASHGVYVSAAVCLTDSSLHFSPEE